MIFLTQSLIAALLTALFVVLLRRPAHRLGLLDEPGGRKRHGDVVPLTGGLAMALAVSVLFPFVVTDLNRYHALIAGAAVMLVIGVLDDRHEISAKVKLIGQIVAAVFMAAWGSVILINLGDIFGVGPVLLGNWGIPLTIFAAVGVINGINMFDGLDGLAGGLCLSIVGALAALAALAGHASALTILTITLGACLGFLAFNAPHRWRGRRRIFMGDTGALLLGFVIAWFTVELSQQGQSPVPPVVMLWVVSVVLFDLFTVSVRRALRKRNPTAPDRAHLHHLLMRRGYSPPAAVALIVSSNALLAATGIIGWRLGLPDYVLFLGFLLVGAAYVSAFMFPARAARRARRRASDRRAAATLSRITAARSTESPTHPQSR
ncbi:MAG: MraY family glycosyltransferase [Betaproteobacteria bacterium]|jgi:UDP-GlcNAc:undecaprenyl-phosphate GlcNAc-1-phosphate transferase